MTDIFNFILQKDELSSMSILGLAHVGDAVYELMARSWLVSQGHTTTRTLHRLTVEMVCAAAQSRATLAITPILTEKEAAVFRRGRNARVNSVPKNARLEDYHLATALEALFGWLYLQGERDRLSELFTRITGGNDAA